MRRKTYRPYVFLALLLFGCLNLPTVMVEPFRHQVMRLVSPFWKRFSVLRASFALSPPFSQNDRRDLEEKIQKLEAENAHINRQNERLKKRLFSADQIESHLKKLKNLSFSTGLLKDFFLRRQKHVEKLIHLEEQSLFAQVIYREPAMWSSAAWIDVGERDNEALGHPVIQTNSPVLAGGYLIGVVELVEKKHSRIRLLTDSSLVVSVRATRGNQKRREMLQLLDRLILNLSLNKESLFSIEEEQALFEKLGTLKDKLQEQVGEKYLAKGEIFGTSSPLWRSRSSILKGVGFNYDFEDDEGPARELRSGKPYETLLRDQGQVLIQEGDLLVTTGMEGIFPPDLPVAIVSKVKPLKEGASSYSIEARLCATKIDELSAVIVLPSLDVDLEKMF